MKRTTKLKSTGFTLVEVVITLVVAAIVGSMLFSVLGTPVTKSSEPLFRMKKSFHLQQVMENFLTAYYEDFEYLQLLPELKYAIDNRLLDPVGKEWEYTIVENRFIKFDAGRNEVDADVTDPGKMLKVTIKSNTTSETLTYVFAP